MKESLNYNLHNILTFKIIGTKRHELLKDLNLPFSFFEIENDIDDPDILLNIGKFIPSNNNCYIVDHKYFIKDNYIYCKDATSEMKWEMEIFGWEEGQTKINYNCNIFGLKSLFSDRVPQEKILIPLIEYKLSKKGCFLLHASGISNGNGYILVGRPGSFKSTLMMDFVRKAGFWWLGDDRVIISDDKILSFIFNPIAIDFKIKHLKTENFRGVLDKIWFINYIRFNSDSKMYYTQIAKIAPLKGIFFVTRTNKNSCIISNIDSNELINKLSNNNIAELISLGFHKYILAYSFIFSQNDILKYQTNLMENLRLLLRNIPAYQIEIPVNYNSDIFNYIYKYVTRAGGYVL